MKPIWHLMLAELRVRLRDRSFWLEAVLLPVAVSAIMGFSLGRIGRGTVPPVHVALVTGAEGNVAADVLRAAFQAAGPFTVTTFADAVPAQAALRSGRADVLVQVAAVDPGASGATLQATVAAGVDGQFRAGLAARVAEAALKTLAAEMGARQAVAAGLEAAGADPAAAWARPAPVPVSPHLVRESLAHVDALSVHFSGLASFFSLLTAFRLMGNLFGPHRRGVSLRLQAVPTWPGSLAAGYMAAVTAVAALQTLLVFAAGRLAFGTSSGSIPLLLAAVVLSSLASAAVALALAVLPLGPAARGLAGLLAVLGGGVVGGALVPLEGAGAWLQHLGQITLQFWVTSLFSGLARGVPVPELAGPFAAVGLYGGLALVMAALFLARRRLVHA